MQDLRVIHFVARHTVELQGLRTALLGALCLGIAIWSVLASLWQGVAVAMQGVWWLPVLLVAWLADERLADFYRARLGCVAPLHQPRRLAQLGLIACIYVALRIVEAQVASPVAISALVLAGVQLHIGLISGDAYRRHYLAGSAVWTVLSFAPQLSWPGDSLAVLWLGAMGITLGVLGWCDHRILMRSLICEGDHQHGEDV